MSDSLATPSYLVVREEYQGILLAFVFLCVAFVSGFICRSLVSCCCRKRRAKSPLPQPALKEFILPSGSLVGSNLHLARTICRRVERRIVALNEIEWVNPSVLIYINRLSDLLFVLARHQNKISHEGEVFVDFKK